MDGDDGCLALLWHLDRSQGTEFWQATQPLYDRYIPDADDRPPRTMPHHVARYERALADDPRFEAAPLEGFPWSRTFDAALYTRLLGTHSPVRMLTEEDREAFIAGHAEVIRELGGTVERLFETVLLTARVLAA